MRDIQADSSTAPGGVARRLDGEPMVVREIDEPRCKSSATRADRGDSGLAKDLRSLGCCIERGNDRSAVQPPKGAGRVLHRILEGERPGVRLPPRECRLQLVAHGGTDVEEARAGTSAEPFENAPGEEVDLASFHVDGNDAD